MLMVTQRLQKLAKFLCSTCVDVRVFGACTRILDIHDALARPTPTSAI